MILRSIPILAALALMALPAAAAPAKPAKAKPAAAKPEPPITVEGLLADSRSATAKGDTQLALRLAQSAIVADPARPTAYVALGDIYAGLGQGEFARSYYDAALNIDPADPAAGKAVAALDGARNTATASK